MWDKNSSTIQAAFIGTGVICLTLFWYLRTTRRHKTSSARVRFETFLIEDASPLPKRQPSNFNSFLADASSSPYVHEKQQTKRMKSVPENAICIPIIYGTEFGFSKEVADALADQIKTNGAYWPIVLNMADFPKGVDLFKEEIVIFVCSTQGDGVPPYEARSFCEWLFDGGSVGDLSALHFSVCALGDKSYAHFCRCGEQIRAALQRQGAHEAAGFVTVDRENWTVIHQWMSDVISALPSLDLSPGRTNLADSAAASGEQEERMWTKHRPFLAKIAKRWNLCRVSDSEDKITMHIQLDIEGSGLSYLPGDAVGIYPNNRPNDVDEIINTLKIDKNAHIPVPSWAPTVMGENGEDAVSLQTALLRFYDLRTPKTKLFRLIQQHLLQSGKGDDLHRDYTVESKLKGNGLHDSGQSICDLQHATEQQVPFLESIVKDMEKRELYLKSRHVIDILQEFPTSSLPLKEFLDSLRPLQPRLYSISSSYLHSSSSVSITVAEVKYQARQKRRVGVASTFLTERLQVGDSVPIYITVNPDFRLPASLMTPTLMIGPGTGLAPFRSFILEKLAIAQRDAVGVNLLFFGCRRRDQDYLYSEMLEDWNERGIIQLHTAFSREQEKKIYVQDVLWENKEAVWKLLTEGGHVYVCGDAQFMAPDVEHCLQRIIQLHGSLDEKGAANHLDTLAASGKYQRDVWF